jgi:hypothetical protein
MRPIRPLIAGALLVVGHVLAPAAAAEGGPAPSDNCVPGTVWEDQASGVKYLCIYDELYGGTRWELMSSSQRGSRGWLSRASTNGCALGIVGLAGVSGGGADMITRSYRWPCATTVDRTSQPRGELRSRITIQRYGTSGWSTCRDSGYSYNTFSTSGWLAGIDMGAAADCGRGTYRALGYGAIFQGGLWRGSALYSPPLWLP